MTNIRKINTPFYSIVAKEILDSVLGQLSDGLWENSRGYDKYWQNFNVKRAADNQIYIEVNADSGNWSSWNNHWLENPFHSMSDSQFLDWLAGKLKAVIQAEAKDEKWQKGWWDRAEDKILTSYLNYDAEISIADVYCVYDFLKGRICRSSDAVVEKVFGKVADEETIRKNEEAKKAAAKHAYDERLKKLADEYEANKKAAYDTYRKAIDEIAA